MFIGLTRFVKRKSKSNVVSFVIKSFIKISCLLPIITKDSGIVIFFSLKPSFLSFSIHKLFPIQFLASDKDSNPKNHCRLYLSSLKLERLSKI
ncbi:hypothetical protein GW796_10655 [archaeon]|nr:hypothetical protein [archaeon]NCQ52322.1 hypothetical protein [archaeon]